jgi:hypothetical protein
VQRNKWDYPGSGINVKRFLCIAQRYQLLVAKGFPGTSWEIIAAEQGLFTQC